MINNRKARTQVRNLKMNEIDKKQEGVLDFFDFENVSISKASKKIKDFILDRARDFLFKNKKDFDLKMYGNKDQAGIVLKMLKDNDEFKFFFSDKNKVIEITGWRFNHKVLPLTRYGLYKALQSVSNYLAFIKKRMDSK